MKLIKNIIINFFFIIISVLITLIFCESVLRFKHSIIPNYDIEMWKYAKKLKIKTVTVLWSWMCVYLTCTCKCVCMYVYHVRVTHTA